MSDKRTGEIPEDKVQEPEAEVTNEQVSNEEEVIVAQPEEEEKDALQIALDDIVALNDKHLRLFSDFENFRRRTAMEKLDLIQNGGETVIRALIPILDDLDRAIANNDKVNDIEAVKEGFALIDNKMRTTLAGKGLEPMDAIGKVFDTDQHEALTKIPAPKKKQKGKVMDVIERGYTLNGKVLRYAKVVVGE